MLAKEEEQEGIVTVGPRMRSRSRSRVTGQNGFQEIMRTLGLTLLNGKPWRS